MILLQLMLAVLKYLWLCSSKTLILQPRCMHLTLMIHPLHRSHTQNPQMFWCLSLEYWLASKGCLLEELSSAHIAVTLKCSPWWRKNQQGGLHNECYREAEKETSFIYLQFLYHKQQKLLALKKCKALKRIKKDERWQS